jgi:hypothetical protein
MALIPKKPKKPILYICSESQICPYNNCFHKTPHPSRRKGEVCSLKRVLPQYKNCPECVEYVKPEPEMYVCPKADKCIMQCYHKTPHEHDPKYCDGGDHGCSTKCLSVLISDVILFEEDFQL